MDLKLFNNRTIRNNLKNKNLVNTFIKELKNIIDEGMGMNQKKHISNEPDLNEENKVIEEYNLYEKKKLLLDNKSRSGNTLAWIMDENSVCISENGDGGPVAINEIELPPNVEVGQVYEKVKGKYIYNVKITEEINKMSLTSHY